MANPNNKWFMSAVLVIAWTHGCIGIYFWLRGKTYFRKISSLLLALAVILPTLSLLGLYQGRAGGGSRQHLSGMARG